MLLNDSENVLNLNVKSSGKPFTVNSSDPAWKTVAQGSVVYVDHGISRGMEYGIAAAREQGLTVELRSLYANS